MQSFDISFDLQTVEQAIETPVIWDAIALIMTSLLCALILVNIISTVHWKKITYIRYTLLSYMVNTDYSSTLQAPVYPWKPFNFLAGCSFQSFRHRLLCLNNLNHWGTWRLFATSMGGLSPLMRLTRTHLLLSSRSIWARTLFNLTHIYDRLYSSPCYQWHCWR